MDGYMSQPEESAAHRFFDELEKHRFMATACHSCGRTFYPPRSMCPRCLEGELQWVELPGTGTLYAFTMQHQGMFHIKPEVMGIVELDGCEGRALTMIDGEFEDLEIGMPVELAFFESVTGDTLHRFRPVT